MNSLTPNTLYAAHCLSRVLELMLGAPQRKRRRGKCVHCEPSCYRPRRSEGRLAALHEHQEKKDRPRETKAHNIRQVPSLWWWNVDESEKGRQQQINHREH